MNIQVRVLSTNALAQIKALQAQVAGLTSQLAKANAVGAIGGGRQISALSKFGNQLQWTGRQLQYNFTLPLVLAGAAATKWAMDNEKAFTRIRKVYGDGTQSATQMENELKALKKAFVALSNEYGVQQSDVLNVAADWAAAGASGVALARSVEQTLKTMVLGEMDAASATEALIAIQAQYNLSSSELADTINTLNMIENQTGVSLQGLIQGFARAAGVAKESGVDIQHLGAMIAALVPTAGSAAQAGNALKTIFSRLISPTGEGVDILGRLGIEIDKVAWKSANGTQRIELLAKKFHGLSDAQKGVVSSTLASRYQINKFNALMEAVYKNVDNNAKTTSYYSRALDSTADRARVLHQAETELAAVLKSNPQKFKQIWVILQNAMADIIIPMIPVLLMAADSIRRMVEAFRGLPIEVQKAVTLGLLFLALFGPLIRYIGSTMTLVGELGWFFGGLAMKIGGVVGSLFSLIKLPFGAAISGVSAIGSGLVAMTGWAGKGFAALFKFMAALPLFSKFGSMAGLIFGGLGKTLVQIWTQTLARIALITGPGLAAVTQAFTFWRIGMARTMQLVGAAMALGWTAITAGAAYVGPALRAGWSATWASLVAITKFGTTAVAVSMRTGFTAIGKFFTNWRLLMVRGFAAMWAGIVVVSKAGVAGTFAMMKQIPKVLASPWTIAIAAVITLLIIFRKQIAQAINNIIQYFQNLPAGVANAFAPLVNIFHQGVAAIVRAFYALPQGVQRAMQAVVNIVYQAAMAVYRLFSYLNPFAHHSPSLVENVTNGMAIVKDQFASITSIEGPIKKAYADIKAFGRAIAGLIAAQDRAKQADDRGMIKKFAPGALDEYDRMIANLRVLTPLQERLSDAIARQQSVVDRLQASLDAANNRLDATQKRLDALQKIADQASASLDEAKQRLNDYANTPITGMKAMGDQIFANEMAQKRLRLEMMKMEDAVGGIDQLRDKMSKLSGEMEMLSGEQASLRQGGAGSEILKQYDDQIKGLEDQQKSITQTASKYDELSNALDELQRKGEMLDLENSLKFDPLKKSIEDAANAMKEMPFDQIMAGMKQAQADIARYSVEVDRANKAVEQQKAVVDAATAARDAISARYDTESAKLDKLKDQYSEVEQAINDINSALQNMTSAAEDAIRRQQDALSKKKGKGGAGGGGGGSPALGNFDAAAGGDFPGVGGTGGLGRDFPGIKDQSKMIDDFTKDIADKTGKLFDSFDIFGPLKQKWNAFTGWFKTNMPPVFSAVGDAWNATLGAVDWLGPFRGIDWKGAFGNIGGVIKDAFQSAADIGKNVWSLFSDDIKHIWFVIKDKFKEGVDKIAPELAKFKDLVKPATEAFKNIWPVIKTVAEILGGALLLALKVVTSILANVLAPAFDMIIGVIKNVIRIVRGFIELVVGIFTGDGAMIWNGLKDIFGGLVQGIWAILKGAVQIIWGIIQGLVEGIVKFFVWLYNVLVGHSIIPDMVKAIINWIASLPGKAWNALKDLGSKIISIVKAAWDWWVRVNGEMWGKIGAFLGSLPGKAADAIKSFGSKISEKARSGWESFKSTSASVWNTIYSWITSLPGKAGSGIASIVTTLGKKGSDAMNSLKNGLTGVWSSVSSWLGGIGGRISSAVGNLGSLLYNAGRNVIQGLIDGLKSKLASLGDIANTIASTIRDRLPFSPAKTGPLSGSGNPELSGRKIGTMVASGLLSQKGTVASAMETVLSTLSGTSDATFTKSIPVARLDGLVGHAEARVARAEAATAPVTYGTTTYRTEIHIHGDLSFPNIKSGDDADKFISHLETLAGGGR